MESVYPAIVMAPVLGLAADSVGQVVTARLIPGRSPYISMAVGILIGMLASIAMTTIAVQWSSFSQIDSACFQLLNAGTYLALAFGYFNFVNLTIASLRIRLLGELLSAGGALDRGSLLEAYNTRKVFDVRLNRLVDGGHLVDRDGRFFIGKRRFLAVARIYNFLRWFVIGPWPSDPPCDATESPQLR